MVSELRVGIIGAGYIARAHLAAYGATTGVRVVAVADPVADKAAALAAHVGAEAVTDARSLLGKVDAVSVCTPSPTHADLVLEALAAGCHVLCEKPLSRTLDDADRMVAAAGAGDRIVMIGHVSRFEPDHARAREIVAAGALGEVRMLSQSIVSATPAWSEGSWLLDHERSGGPIVDLAIHSLDYLAWVNGSRAIRVDATAARTDAGADTYALITVRYADGAIGSVETSWGHPSAYGFKVATEISGTMGRLWWDYDGLVPGVVATAAGESRRLDVLGDRGFRAEIRAFVEAIRTGGPSPIPAAAARDALRTAIAALTSVRTGQPVTIEELAA